MPYPATGQERARSDIAETFLEMDLAMNIAKLVGTTVLPVRNVPIAHGSYPRVKLKDLMRRPLASVDSTPGHAYRRTPRGAYVRDEFKFEQSPYRTIEHGNEGMIDENERAHYASELEHEAITALWIRHKLLIEQEIRIANQCFSTTTFGTGQNATPAVKWDVPATATPVIDVNNAKKAIINLFGMWPDCIVMNKLAWMYLVNTNDIRERIHAQGAGTVDRQTLITRSMVAQAFDLDEVIVADAMYDTTNENTAAFAGNHIWGPHALVFKKVRGTSIREIGLGHTFHWAADRSMPQGYVEDYREPAVRNNIIRVRHQTHELIKYNFGYLLTDIYTP